VCLVLRRLADEKSTRVKSRPTPVTQSWATLNRFVWSLIVISSNAEHRCVLEVRWVGSWPPCNMNNCRIGKLYSFMHGFINGIMLIIAGLPLNPILQTSRYQKWAGLFEIIQLIVWVIANEQRLSLPTTKPLSKEC
jgi:hypothetical protein